MCVDVDECTEMTEPCPGTGRKCVNYAGSFYCDCQPGYRSKGCVRGICVHAAAVVALRCRQVTRRSWFYRGFFRGFIRGFVRGFVRCFWGTQHV